VDYDQLKNYYIERKIGDAVAYLLTSHAKDIPLGGNKTLDRGREKVQASF
jgi:hypothetical protein